MKRSKLLVVLAGLLLCCTTAMGQRVTDKIDRGLVAVPGSSGGNFVSWRVLGEEYYDVTYNLYANGTLLNKTPLTVSNYSHSGGTTTTKYQVAAVVRGVEQPKCDAVTRWTSNALRIPVQKITGRDGSDVTSNYTLNDVSIGDLDGDGVVEFIVKRPCGVSTDVNQKNCFHVLDCYDRKGNRLWWIDMGPNMQAGPDEQWDCVCFDWDQDGKAEVLLRGADNMYIHHADGTTTKIGNDSDTRWSGMEYTASGNEYLLYLEGATGKPYKIGPASHPDYMDYPNPRGQDSDWGSGIAGHRSTKHYFGAPYLDGRHASIFLGRGCYTKHLFKAFDVDPATHKLTQRWAWECSVGGIWFGQGYHNYQIADVDWDGRDEIMFGSMVIDDNGKGLSSSGLGHGDAQHCSDFDPYRWGQEQYCCNESAPNCNYRNATTSKFYYRNVGTADDGRALMGNFTDDIPGSQGSTVGTGWLAGCADKIIPDVDYIGWSDLNQRLYWDGDLLDEYFDSPGTEKTGVVYKVGGGRWDLSGSQCNNWSKNNPGGIADIFGDWREEVIMREGGNQALLVFTTNIPTEYRIPTLWSDHQYRNAMVWQSMGYNQPPHKSYFLGKLEGITQAPPPLTMTGRKEVSNGGSITSGDDHLIVCEMNDTKVSIANGASPYMLTFYVPSWVQGNAGNNATTNPAITYKYFTCDVTGGALTGSTRVVKQGDGTLNLPKVDMTYTGRTDIWNGVVNFDGTLKNSTLWLNRFAELNTAGTFRSIQADYAAKVRPGGANSMGTLTTDTLLLGFGSRLIVDLYSEGIACDGLNIGKLLSIETKTGTQWQTYGPEYLTPVLEIVAHKATGATKLAAGEYVLGNAPEVIKGKLTDIKIEGLDGQKVALENRDGKLILNVTDVREASTVYWTGAASKVWDFANAMNFSNEGNADYFVSGDNVIFDDASTVVAVTLNSDLDPATVTVTGKKSFSFNGTGSLTGKCSLIKEGTGTLTINTDNTFTGSTTISGGTIKVATLSNENQAKGALGGHITKKDHIVIENAATLQTTAAVTVGSPITLRGTDGGAISNSADFNMNNIFTGTLLEKKGTGWLKLYNDNTLTNMVISAGAVQQLRGAAASTVTLQGGALYDDASNTAHAIVVPKGKSGTWYLSNTYYLAYGNKLTGEGTITIVPRNTVSRVRITGNWASFEGTIKHTTKDIWLPLDMNATMPKATLDIAEGCTVACVPGRTLTFGAVTGKGNLCNSDCNYTGSQDVSGLVTWKIGNSIDKDFTYAGQIRDNNSTSTCAFSKVGTCKMTFTGSGEFTGAARVDAGELCLNSTASTAMLGTSTLNVAKGATLSGKGTLANSTVTVAAGGVLRSGITETNSVGNLKFSSKNVTVNGDMQTYINTKTAYSKFTGIGTLKLNGTLVVKGSATLALEEGTEIQIIDASKVTLGANLQYDLCAPNVNDPTLVFSTERLSEGILVVVRDTTPIESISADQLQGAAVYTIGGQRVVGTPNRRGIYVVNGKKVVLK